MKMKHFLSGLVSFVSVSVLFWVLGTGVGFLQAYYGYFPLNAEFPVPVPILWSG